MEKGAFKLISSKGMLLVHYIALGLIIKGQQQKRLVALVIFQKHNYIYVLEFYINTQKV